jgi:hypothetical protein
MNSLIETRLIATRLGEHQIAKRLGEYPWKTGEREAWESVHQCLAPEGTLTLPIDETDLRRALVDKHGKKPREMTEEQIREGLAELLHVFWGFEYLARPELFPAIRPVHVEFAAIRCDLQKRFRDAAQRYKNVRVHWMFTLWPQEEEDWRFEGGVEVERYFNQLAMLAAAGFRLSAGKADRDDWLTLLRRRLSEPVAHGPWIRRAGKQEWRGISVVLENVFDKSAILYEELETQALAAQQLTPTAAANASVSNESVRVTTETAHPPEDSESETNKNPNRKSRKTSNDPVAVERQALWEHAKENYEDATPKRASREQLAQDWGWKSRSIVDWWLANDARSKEQHDKHIRKKLKQPPYSVS